MASQYISMDNVRFLLNEVHHAEDLLSYPRYEEFDQEGIDMMLDSAKDLADQELFPYFREMDAQPVVYKDGKIIVHPQLENIIKKGAENGWIGAAFDYDDGGIQLPAMIYAAANHIFYAANNHAVGYLGLTTGAARLILSFADQQLKDTYVQNMIDGQWAGTMALTEPQAGSSLSDLVTSATPTDEGYYLIEGQKIFISGGDHAYADNFVHLMLARIKGAPEGTRGISLFVVPKFRPENDGSLTWNDVTTAGDFQKMGQKGYATTHLLMGDNNDCRGWLVGEPNMGLKYMFQMMNAARIDVGIAAASTATAAYYASLQYANERAQGRKIMDSGKKDVSAEPTLIINHPDVRRMLFLQKAITEGSVSLLLYCTKLEDLVSVSEGEEKENAHLLLELLTPIAKTYPSEMGQVSISNGLQILGGYGYTIDFPLEQYYRDIRIMSLYEGTTGIQSLDLLGRKSTMKNGKAVQLLMAEIQKCMQEAQTYDDLKPYAAKLAAQLGTAQKVMGHLMGFAQKGDFQLFLADATLFMELTSTIVVAWQWLMQAVAAKKALVTGNLTYSQEFYESKIHTMRFYFKYEIPKIAGLAQTLMDTDSLTLVEEKEMIF